MEKKSQQLAYYVAIDFICFYLTIERFENETSIFCRNYHQKRKKHQATWWHDLLLTASKNPVLLVEVASIPVKGMKLCICAS